MSLGSLQTLPYLIIAFLVAITVHEYAHAWMADRLGDPTPRMRGRLSLNPIVHLDIVGTLLLVVAGFGWAKPVEVNPRYFPNWRQGMLVVAAAGPLSNITLVFLVGLLVQLGVIGGIPVLERLAYTMIIINAMLAVFNLIPVPPLDGSRILSSLLPPAQSLTYDRLAPYGPLVLLALILLPGNILGFLIRPGINWLARLALGGGPL
jgi:Zn-dependent protease